MLRIGDFSKSTCITVKALRYYDKIGLLVPKHIDPENRYRYYGADQMKTANQILVLKQLGFSLQEIDEVICQGVSVESRLIKKREELQATLKEKQTLLKTLDRILSAHPEEEIMTTINVIRKHLPDQKAVTLRRVIESYQAQGGIWGELEAWIKRNGAQPTEACFTVDFNEGYKEKDVDLMVCEIIDRTIPDSGDIQTITLPGGEFASCIHKGSYEGLHQAFIHVMKWIDRQGLVVCGPDREIYHENMATTDNPEEFVTEILIPIKEK